MKKTRTLYWVFTILFVLSMVPTAIPDIMLNKDAIDFMHGKLGYPNYFTVFIGWAKIIGCIAILIPGYPRIKEWAYAGLFFDLFGAIYSGVAAIGFKLEMSFMLIWVILFVLAYVWYRKLDTLKAANQ